MPLKSGKSKSVISGNIGKTLSEYKSTGKIGTSRPASMKKARSQAAAIAYSKARGGKSKSGRKK